MSIILSPDLDWRADAACLEYSPDMFFPDKEGPGYEAKRVCAGCPVKNQCIEFALDNDIDNGIWGGLGRDMLRKIRANRSAA